MGKLNIGIDLGGTKIYAVVLDEKFKKLGSAKSKTGNDHSLKALASQMKDTASEALKEINADWKNVNGVGVAVPSSIDHETGTILHAPNLGLKNIPATPVFKTIFGRNVYMGNDVNCGVWAEYRLGAAKDTNSAIGYFLGTGLGGGVVVDGKLQTGAKGLAGELGHTIVKYKGRRCNCGNRGCLEAYCSKVAFSKRFHKLINKKLNKSVLKQLMGKDFSKLKSSILAKAYKQEDRITCYVLNKGAYMLGVASASMVSVLGPECIVYGGGVMEALGKELMPHIREGLKDHLFGLKPKDVSLKLSELEDDAVAVGAALLIKDKIKA